VDAVEHGGAERPLARRPAEEVVPDVLRELERVVLGVERVAAGASADGEHNLDALGLARGDVRGEVGAGVGVGVAVAGEVELRGPAGAGAGAEAAEEGDVDEGVVARGARLGEAALVAVLAPVDGDAVSVASGS
jgi:hypothetical protein